MAKESEFHQRKAGLEFASDDRGSIAPLRPQFRGECGNGVGQLIVRFSKSYRTGQIGVYVSYDESELGLCDFPFS
jgi:hypothetical protein